VVVKHRTRVVCTLGRAVPGGGRPQDAADYVAGLVVAGMDVARLNLAHARGAVEFMAGRAPDYDRERTSMEAVRRAAASAGPERHVAILLDLQGAKVRVTLPETHRVGGLAFDAGATLRMRLTLHTDAEDLSCDASERILVALRDAVAEHGSVKVAFADGVPVLDCDEVDGDVAVLRAAAAGVLRSRKTVTFRGVVPEREPKMRLRDRIDIAALALPAALRGEADFLALSFLRSVDDLRALRAFCRSAINFFRRAEDPADEEDAQLFRDLDERCPSLRARYAESSERLRIVAKIETRAATRNLDGMLAEADGVMISRGDLSLRCSPSDVPRLQKDIIRRARLLGRPVIVATQMLGNMEHSDQPTRSEAADVFNAVLDGSDALMLSAETAVGAQPHASVLTLRAIAASAEEWEESRMVGRGFSLNQLGRQIEALRAAQQRVPGWVDVTDRITLEAVRVAEGLGLEAIVALTRSGNTARLVARFDPLVPVIALVPNERVARRLALVASVRAVVTPSQTDGEALDAGLQRAVEAGLLTDGARVLVVGSREGDPRGATTTLSVRRVRGEA
jgi:pyruvate kinase